MQNAANDQAAHAPNYENGSIRFSDDGIRQTQEEAEEQSDGPTRLGRKLNAGDDKSDGEAADQFFLKVGPKVLPSQVSSS